MQKSASGLPFDVFMRIRTSYIGGLNRARGEIVGRIRTTLCHQMWWHVLNRVKAHRMGYTTFSVDLKRGRIEMRRKLGKTELLALIAAAGVGSCAAAQAAKVENAKTGVQPLQVIEQPARTNLGSGADSACGKGACGTDESGAKAAAAKHSKSAKKSAVKKAVVAKKAANKEAAKETGKEASGEKKAK